MTGIEVAEMAKRERHYLLNVLKSFKPEHANFKPAEGMYTVGQQIKHIATTIRWFRNGIFGSGFDMNFEQYFEEMKKPVELTEAMALLDAVYDDWILLLKNLTEEELSAPMKDNPIFGNVPTYNALISTGEHTAHHRGALTVYLRLLGITPIMVYTE